MRDKKEKYPYYLHTIYKEQFKKFIKNVALHIQGYSKDVKDKIIAVQCPVGKSGDSGSYKGNPVNKAYNISEDEGKKYTKEILQYYYDTYKAYNPHIICLINVDEEIHQGTSIIKF